MWLILGIALLNFFNAIPTNAFPLTSFQQFTFAPNGVCIDPPTFVSHEDGGERIFTMKNVPGEGDCMFLATALATATSMGLGANDVLLRQLAKQTRQVVANILEAPDGTNLFVADKRLVPAKKLLQQATREVGLTNTEDYLKLLRKEGCDGGLYGGGPELTVLSNVLRRPISIYELAANEVETTPSPSCPILRQGVFGDRIFADPCRNIPNSAVLSNVQPGAYSWHLHLLIVEASPVEKHACVLLPQTPI